VTQDNDGATVRDVIGPDAVRYLVRGETPASENRKMESLKMQPNGFRYCLHIELTLGCALVGHETR